MQLPSTTLFLVLISLVSAGLGEAASSTSYKPPTTYSPDYKQCKNGVKSDPSCVPVMSDEEVAYLRSTGRRFKLLNEKRPDLKPFYASASRAAAAATATSTGTGAQMVAPGLVRPELNYPNGDGSGNDNGKSAPSYVVLQQDQIQNQNQNQDQSQNMVNRGFGGDNDDAFDMVPEHTFLDGTQQKHQVDKAAPETETDTDTNTDADSTGNRKYGFGSGGWGRPFLIKRDTNDFAFPSTAVFSSYGSGSGSGYHWNAPSFPSFGFTSLASTAAPLSAADVAVADSAVVLGNGGQAEIVTNTESDIAAHSSTSVFTDAIAPQQGQDSIGNAKWGFGGGWGRPWRRDDFLSDDCTGSPGSDASKEDMGNMKWGFGSGGWGRPFAKKSGTQTRRRRDCGSTIFDSALQPAEDIAQPEILVDAMVEAQSSPAVAEAPTYGYAAELSSPNAEGAGIGNMKWGFGSGGWGRPFARSAITNKEQEQEQDEYEGIGGAGRGEADDTGNREYGFGSGGWGRPY
ncbi:hypothetical protein IAU59_004088 [Kwoniella sp. CBS 9459]